MTNQLKNKNGLAEKQQNLLLQIQESHRLVLKHLYSSLYVIATFLLVTIFFIFFAFDEIWTIDIIIFILNTSIFALVALNNIRTLWPFWKQIDRRFKRIREKTILTDSSIIQDGVTSYINRMQSMIYHSMAGEEKTPFMYSEKFEHQLNARLGRSWIIHLVIGIIIVVINHIVIVFLFQPQIGAIFWLYIMYIGILLTYGAMVVREKQVKAMFQRWVCVFKELDAWAETLELMPVVHEIDQLADVEET